MGWSLEPASPFTYWNNREWFNKHRKTFIPHRLNLFNQLKLKSWTDERCVNRGEKNFHIFQYLIDGLGANGKLREYQLDLYRKDHKYISSDLTFTDEQKRVLTTNPLNFNKWLVIQNERCNACCFQTNIDKFHLVQKGFQQLGFTADQINSIHSILAAIILLGDLQFIHADSRDNTERCILKNPKQVEPGKKLQDNSVEKPNSKQNNYLNYLLERFQSEAVVEVGSYQSEGLNTSLTSWGQRQMTSTCWDINISVLTSSKL